MTMKLSIFSRFYQILFFVTLLSGLSAPLAAQNSASESPGTLTVSQGDENFARFLEDFKGNIRKVTLPNGLRLIMVQKRSAPVVACYIKIKAGAVDETDKTSGIAHMLEHMLFKGTRVIGTRNYEGEEKYLKTINKWAARLDFWRREQSRLLNGQSDYSAEEIKKNIQLWQKRLKIVNEMARPFINSEEDSYLYALNGSTGFNAYTSNDLTNYQIKLPANKLELWARIESDRFKNSVLRDFYIERDVVVEERKMRVDNVSRSLLFENFLMSAYRDHPYGRPVIGPMESIKFLSYENAYDFYKRYYSPNNMVIAIVGDIEFEEVHSLVTQYFGDLAPQKIPPRPKPALPEHREPLRYELTASGSPLLLQAWFKPQFPHTDDLSLEIIGEVLAGGQHSRLYRRLVLTEKLATRVSIFTSFPGERYTNLFTVYVEPLPGVSYDKIEEVINSEIEKVIQNGVEADEFLRVKKGLQNGLVKGIRSYDSLADYLSFYEMLTGDYQTMFDYYKKLDELKLDSLKETAARYLTPEKIISARLYPAKREASR